MLHRSWNRALVMLMVSYCSLWSAANRVVYSLSEATQVYTHRYTDAEIVAFPGLAPGFSLDAITVELAEIVAGLQGTRVFYGTNHHTWQTAPDAPGYYGYYALDEQQQPRLLCNIGDLFPIEMNQGPDLFPQLMTDELIHNLRLMGQPVPERPLHSQLDKRFLLGGLSPSLLALTVAYYAESTTQQFTAAGIGMLASAGMLALGKYLRTKARYGLYTFTPLEAEMVKQDLRSRLSMQHAALQNTIVAGRVHQIIDEVVNSTTGYPVVYTNADLERSPSRVINATTHGPRRTTTDALWVADMEVEDSYAENMARHKFGQKDRSYKNLMVGGGVGLVAATCALGLLSLERLVAS